MCSLDQCSGFLWLPILLSRCCRQVLLSRCRRQVAWKHSWLLNFFTLYSWQHATEQSYSKTWKINCWWWDFCAPLNSRRPRLSDRPLPFVMKEYPKGGNDDHENILVTSYMKCKDRYWKCAWTSKRYGFESQRTSQLDYAVLCFV